MSADVRGAVAREDWAGFLTSRRIGYFSMEIALKSEIPTYSGGLGVLAGDTVRSAADLRIPMVAVSLVSRKGYFRQEIDAQGRQIEHPDPWDPSRYAYPLPAKIVVPIEGRDVWVGGWLYVLEGVGGGREPVILLDTDLPENRDDDRRITDSLYGGDAAYRLKQEIVLGIGGVRMLDALGSRISLYHLNEGHSALLTLQLLLRHAYEPDDLRPGEPRYDVPRVRDLCLIGVVLFQVGGRRRETVLIVDGSKSSNGIFTACCFCDPLAVDNGGLVQSAPLAGGGPAGRVDGHNDRLCGACAPPPRPRPRRRAAADGPAAAVGTAAARPCS